MTLAIKLEQVVRNRRAPNYAALAEVGHLSRARLSQIMTLTNLAPVIQETVLLLPRRVSGEWRRQPAIASFPLRFQKVSCISCSSSNPNSFRALPVVVTTPFTIAGVVPDQAMVGWVGLN